MDPVTGPGRPLRALELRHMLTWLIHRHGGLTIRQMLELLASDGFSVLGRPSKTVSDALRWEVARGRVVRQRRGRYGPGRIPRTTAQRIRRRVDRIYAGEATSYWAIMPGPVEGPADEASSILPT